LPTPHVRKPGSACKSSRPDSAQVAVVVVLLIHQRRPLSVWLLASLLPALVGAYFSLAF